MLKNCGISAIRGIPLSGETHREKMRKSISYGKTIPGFVWICMI
jgi:hypothetical protein